jgi:hypothetical protein
MRFTTSALVFGFVVAAGCKSAQHRAGVKDDEPEVEAAPAPEGEPEQEPQGDVTEAGGTSPAELYKARADALRKFKTIEPGTPEYKVAIGSIYFDAPASSSEADFTKATAAIFAGVPDQQAAAYKFYVFGRTNAKAPALGRLGDIVAADPGFKKFTSLHQDNPEASEAVLGKWSMVNNMMVLYGMMHRGQPIALLTEPTSANLIAVNLKAMNPPTLKDGTPDPKFQERASVLAYEIAELKKQGWRLDKGVFKK